MWTKSEQENQLLFSSGQFQKCRTFIVMSMGLLDTITSLTALIQSHSINFPLLLAFKIDVMSHVLAIAENTDSITIALRV